MGGAIPREDRRRLEQMQPGSKPESPQEVGLLQAGGPPDDEMPGGI